MAVLTLAASLALTAGASAQEITVDHAQGQATLTGVPEKVFTFDIATLDTLNAIGVEVDGIPDASLPDGLSAYADILKIGSLFEPDYELVNAEQPDVIDQQRYGHGGDTAQQQEGRENDQQVADDFQRFTRV